jgi:hypothetical protein
LSSMRLLDRVTRHLKTGRVEIRCDPEELNTPSDYDADI